MTRPTRRLPRALLAVAAVCLVQLPLTSHAATGVRNPVTSHRHLTTSKQSAAPRWLSGASGDSVPTGQFGAWRGRPVDIATTWSDNDDNMVNFYQLQGSGGFAHWHGDLDIAIGAFDSGETWQKAATGAYDARWRTSLTKLAQLRAPQGGTTYLRFAHEMNGSWYPWKVTASDRTAFVASWKRFRALQKAIYPSARLVFSVNRESVGSGFDWRTSFPGKAYVDVLGVDYYNQYPFVKTRADWNTTLSATDPWGAPKGLDQHLAFARKVGLPLAISEWGSNSTMGDSPEFMTDMHAWFASHAGTTAGHLLYESYFDVVQYGNAQYSLSPTNHQPKAAATYRQLW